MGFLASQGNFLANDSGLRLIAGLPLTRTVSGLIMSEDFASIADWTPETGDWSVEEDAAYIAYPVPRVFLPLGAAGQSDDSNVRQVWCYRDNLNTLWAFYDGSDQPNLTTATAGVHAARSRDGGKTWVRYGRQLDPSDGYWARINGFVLLVSGTYYLYSLADNPAGTGDGQPYLTSIFSAPSLTGPWSFVRDFPGVGAAGQWDATSHYTSCVIPDSGTYRAFIGGISDVLPTYNIGMDESSAPGGVFTKDGALTIPNAGKPENVKVWFDNILNRWCMLSNQVHSSGLYTDRNRMFLSTSITDWSSATYKDVQSATAAIDTSQLDVVGVAAPVYNLDATVYRDGNYLPFSYDGLPTDGNQIGRKGLAGVLEPSRYCAKCAVGAGGSTLYRAQANTNFVAEFAFDLSAAAPGAVEFSYRRDNSGTALTNGYALSFSTAGAVALYSVASGTPTTLESHSIAAFTLQRTYRLRVEVSGTSHKAYLDGDEIINSSDATYASGAAISLRAQNCTARFRNLHMRTSNTVTISGADAPVSLLSHGGLYVAEHQTSITHTHYPMRYLVSGGIFTKSDDGIYGGDTWTV